MLTLERAAETNDLQFYIFEISLFFFLTQSKHNLISL